jgi:hypothetical protein
MDVVKSYYQLHIVPRLQRWNLLKSILNPVDILSILIAFQCCYSFNNFDKGGFFFSDLNVLELFIWILPFWVVILSLVRVTGISTKRHKVLFFLYLQSSISIFFLLSLFNFILKLDSMPRQFVAELSLSAFLLLYFGRIATYSILKSFGVRGYNNVNSVIIADDSSLSFISNLISKTNLGYHVSVIFTESELVKTTFENSMIILPEKFLGILNDLIKVDFIDEVLYLKEKPDSVSFREILRSCEDMGITLRLKSKDPAAKLSSAVKTSIGDGKFLSFLNIPNNSYALAIKKTMDINIALLMIVVLLPVLALISIVIKLTSKGPVICNYAKTGWRGQPIKLYRFRTMFTNDSGTIVIHESEPDQDTRLTSVGRFLLMSGLDQLPQLFNVLKGEIPIIAHRHPLRSNQAVTTKTV